MVLRKIGHAAAYAVLALLVLLAVGGATGGRRDTFVLLVVVAYAISDEIHQGFVPGRDTSPIDVAIDSIGAAVAVGLARRVTGRAGRA